MNREPLVEWRREGHVGIIRLNRSEKLNALNYEMLLQFERVIDEISQAYKEVRVVLVTAGGRAFSVGADLKERRTLNEEQVRRNVKKIGALFGELERLPQPTIAVINGYAFGGGLELALACDFRFALESAQLGLTEVSLGIIPGAGGTQRLARLIGPAKAKELIFTARKISAKEAKELGIINEIAENREELQTRALSLAEEILQNAPLAVYQAKFAIDHGYGLSLQTGLEIESKAYEVIIPSKDRLEALDAFQQKRKPVFRGE